MDEATIARYQPGGDIYNRMVSQYGVNSANSIASAATSGDPNQLWNAIAIARGDGPALDGSTGSILLNQLETNPLGAPLDAANTALQNSFFSVLKNPFVLLAIGGVAFFALGGADVIRKYIKNL